MLVPQGPIYIESVERISDSKYRLHSWWQDCLAVNDGILFESLADV